MRDDITRFMGFVRQLPNGCWEWIGRTTDSGYAVFWVDGRQVRAFRWIIGQLGEPVPDDLEPDHTCHTDDRECSGGDSCPHRRCVNPEHGEAVTHAENARRGFYNLVAHARRELERIGEDPDVIEWFLRVVREFASFGHTGGSASICIPRLARLLSYEPLSPLTDDPAEWEDRAEIMGQPWWQNIRDSRAMSKDGGRTYWLVTDTDPAPRHTSAAAGAR